MWSEENKFDIMVINSYIKVNKLTKKSFCKLCGISLETLNKIYANETDFLLSDLFKIANTLKIAVAGLFVSGYYSKIQTRFTL